MAIAGDGAVNDVWLHGLGPLIAEPKLIDGEGWAAERKLFSHVKGKEDFTHAEWEKEKNGKASLFLTVDALEILQAAGRLE